MKDMLENMADYLLRKAGGRYDRDVILYGMDTAINGILCLTIVMIIALLCNDLYGATIYFIIHVLCVRRMGGYHARTRIGCMILTGFSFYVITYITHRIFVIDDIFFACLIEFACVVCVVRYVPVIDYRKVLVSYSPKEKVKSILLMLCISTVAIISLANQHRLGIYIIVNQIEVVVFIIIGKEVNYHRERNHINSNIENI